MNGQMPSLKALLRRVSPQKREDAIQEAWVAHLSGESVITAVGRFADRESAFAKRNGQLSVDIETPMEVPARKSHRIRSQIRVGDARDSHPDAA